MAPRNVILQNFWWKLLSLFVAALAWFLIETEVQKSEQQAKAKEEVETTSQRPFPGIPITVLTSPSNTNRFKIVPEFVFVEVGCKDDKMLDELQARRVQAFVDVTDSEDEKQFRKPIQIKVPEDFVVLTITPTNASIERITSPN